MQRTLQLLRGLVLNEYPSNFDIDQMTDEEFAVELDRRANELRQNPELGIPWEVVKKMS
jgi:hypothetical protein